MRAAASPLAIAAGCLVLLAGGCGGVSSRPDGSDVAVEGVPASVRVVFPGFGADPDTLRYHFDEGERATWAMRVDLDQTVDGSEADLPPFTLTFDTDVEHSSKERIEISLAITGVEVDGGPVGDVDLDRLLEPMHDLNGTFVLGPDGTVIGSTLHLPAELTPALKIVLAPLGDASVLVPPLPAEPVGLGAQWIASSTVALSGTTVDEQATYTLSSIEGDTFSLHVGTSQGIEIDADAGASAGTSHTHGQIDGSLTQLIGHVAHGRQTTRTTLRQPDSEQLLEVDVQGSARIHSRAPAGTSATPTP